MSNSNSATLITGDAIEILGSFADNSFDLTVTSPPYEDARTYGRSGKMFRGESWVRWFLPYCQEMARVTAGMVIAVVEGRTQQFRYSATPILLAADLHRAGLILRKPLVYQRNGIPGSGGPDWFRNDWEFVLAFSRRPGKLLWSDPTACGGPPKYTSGGGFTSRKKNGDRVDAAKRPYPKALERTNPGNVIHLAVGGGKMGHELASENEAPFHVNLPAFFIKSLCPPNGTVLDPFGGSHSTGHAALINGRDYIGIDERESQTKLGLRRLSSLGRVVVADPVKEAVADFLTKGSCF